MRKFFAAASVLAAAVSGAALAQDDEDAQPAFSLENVARNLSQEAREIAARDVTALQFYADWCAQCRRLDPNLRAAADAFVESNVDIIVLDFTDRGPVNVEAQREKAALIGAEDIFDENARKTGFVILVADGEEVGRITARMNVDQIEEQLFHAAG